IGPKALCRIVRLRSAFAAHQAGAGWTEAALGAGFCDQAHLAREARAVLGAPPCAFEERRPLAAAFGVAADFDPALWAPCPNRPSPVRGGPGRVRGLEAFMQLAGLLVLILAAPAAPLPDKVSQLQWLAGAWEG